MHLAILPLATAMSLAVTSCAHDMQVTSEPPGAAIYVDGRAAGVTPRTVVVPLRETPLHVRVAGATDTAEVTIERGDVAEAIAASGAIGVTGAALSIVAIGGWVSWLSQNPSEGGAVLLFGGTPLLVAASASAVALAAWAPLEMAQRATPARVSFALERPAPAQAGSP
jgi:hypothetical protein